MQDDRLHGLCRYVILSLSKNDGFSIGHLFLFMRTYFVYILRCKDGSYYTGVTNDVERRVKEHQQGLVPGYTHSRRPVQCVFAESFYNIWEAIAAEKQIKGWTRKKKEALTCGNYDELVRLSHRHGSPFDSSSSQSSESRSG